MCSTLFWARSVWASRKGHLLLLNTRSFPWLVRYESFVPGPPVTTRPRTWRGVCLYMVIWLWLLYPFMAPSHSSRMLELLSVGIRAENARRSVERIWAHLVKDRKKCTGPKTDRLNWLQVRKQKKESRQPIFQARSFSTTQSEASPDGMCYLISSGRLEDQDLLCMTDKPQTVLGIPSTTSRMCAVSLVRLMSPVSIWWWMWEHVRHVRMVTCKVVKS